jgi:hypothetical protein
MNDIENSNMEISFGSIRVLLTEVPEVRITAIDALFSDHRRSFDMILID